MQQFTKALSHIPKKKSGPTRLMGVKLKIDNPHEALRLGALEGREPLFKSIYKDFYI